MDTSDGIITRIADLDYGEDASVDSTGRRREMDFKLLSQKWLEFSLGFFEAAPLFGAMAGSLQYTKAQEEPLQFLEDVAARNVDIETSKEGEKRRVYVINRRNQAVYGMKMKSLNRFQRQTKAYSESFILSLVAQYEAIISDVMRAVLHKHPSTYISKDTTVSAVDVINASDVSSIKERIIEDKLDVLLRQSHDKLVLDFLGRLKIEEPSVSLMRDFKEICERRNLITHAGGIVNSKYIQNIIASGVSGKDLPRIGEALISGPDYIMTANARVSLLGFWVIHCVWLKMYPKDTDSVFNLLNTAIHDFLVHGFTKMARRLCDFALGLNCSFAERTKAYIIVNLTLTYHLEHGISEEERAKGIEQSLALRDWSIRDPKLDLALCCIRNDFDNLASRLDDAVRAGVGIDDFSTWALFTKVRCHKVFREKMKQHFGVDVSDEGEFDQKSASPTS